ncbi:MAG: TonB-dependent receptor [Bacteroidota bacterium]
MKKVLLLLLFLSPAIFVFAQRTITGKVTDPNGIPVANASVTVKGSSRGTVSNATGDYSITVDQKARSLVFSHTGMATAEIPIGTGNEINVSFKQAENALQEVVVVAYGEQQRRKVTGAVGKLSGTEVENVPMSSVDQMLQGKVAGLQSVAPSGQPGSFQDIRIRGIGSINASSSPLFVIDGIPVNSGDFSGATSSSNMLAGLNPNDIESISVLKDAASASIYGSRAANGVIIINTRKGRAGKTKIRVDTEFGSNSIAYQPSAAKALTKSEFLALSKEGILNVGGTQTDVDDLFDQLGFNSPADYNWLDLVKRKGQQQQVNVSASGGDQRTQFFISGGFFNQQSMIIGSDFKRYSANFNIKHQVDKRLSMGISLNLSTFHQQGESESGNFRNPIIAAAGLLPMQEAYNADGTPNYDPTVFTAIFNPLATAKYDRLGNQTSKLLGTANVEYKILDNLKVSSRFGLDYSTIDENLYWNPFFGDGATPDPSSTGYVFNRNNRLSNWVWTNLADYNFKTRSGNVTGNVTAGYEAQQSKQLTLAGQGSGLPFTTSILYPSPVTALTPTYAGSDYSFVSLLSKAEVTFFNKYSISGSVRRDGSSRFGENNRYGTFWSVGGAWNIDQEKFMSNISTLSLLKLRASYGVNGNASIDNYQWRPTYSYTTTYNGLPGSFPANVGNLNLTWEQNKPLDIGLEVGILKNRVIVEADYYKRKTDKLLLDEPLSYTSGFDKYKNNVGAMENKGFELTVNTTPIKTKDFTWTFGFNAAWNKNKVTKLVDGQTEIRTLPYLVRIGEDVQSIFTRLWAGADPANGDPLWYTDDTKKQTTNDFSQVTRTIIGSASPKGFGGVTTSLTYKSISLEAQLNYQYGNYVNDGWGFIFQSDGAYPTLNQYKKALERWQKPGDITDVPRYDYANSTASNAASTRYFFKGDYLRLRNVTLGFDMPPTILKKLQLTKLNFYIRATNIWTKTFDKNITIDPEQQINGSSDLQYFIPKSINVGLNIQL